MNHWYIIGFIHLCTGFTYNKSILKIISQIEIVNFIHITICVDNNIIIEKL